MEKNNQSKNILIFSLIFYLLLFFTNQYYPLKFSIHIGFFDQLMYLKIIDSAPYFPSDEIRPHQAARFFVPYLIGSICDYIQIKEYLYPISVGINIFVNLLIIKLFLQITSHFKVERNFNLIIIAALISNAYYFRVSLYAPLMINDILFSYGLLLITFYLIKKKISYFYIGLILCCITRQTALMLNIVFFVIIFYKLIYRTKTNITIFIIGIIINTLLFLLLKNISGNFSDNEMSYLFSHVSALFSLNYSFLDLILIFLRLIIANAFILLLSIFFFINLNFYKKVINFDLFVIFIIGLSIWIQPILGSPTYTGSNISRLTILSMPVFLVLFSIIFKNIKLKFSHSVIIIILIFLSNLHHHYTYFFNLFFDFKNYQFGILNFLSHLFILMLLLKNYSKDYNKKVE